jgi:hypothetical protein
VKSLSPKVMAMMMISSTTNNLSTISTLLMKVVTPFLIVPTTIITSKTTSHQNSFTKMKKPIPSLTVKIPLPGTNVVTSGSDISASGGANPGPVILPNDKTAFSSTPQFPKDKANLVKLELVNFGT